MGNKLSTLKIIITSDYKIQVKYIRSLKNNKIIHLSEDHPEEYYTPCIAFNGNFITVCHNNDSAIHFMQQWLTNPDEFTLYPVQYQGKEYKLLPEVLFAIIINEFKKKVEKEYIIEETILQLPEDNEKVFQRLKISLNAINLKGMSLEDENIEYDYPFAS